MIPLSVAQLGGRIQEHDNHHYSCEIMPLGNTGLTLPDTQESRDADRDGDGLICGVSIGSE